MKKYALILALFIGCGIANAVESNTEAMSFDPTQMRPALEENGLTTALKMEPANQILLDEMLNQGKSLEFSTIEMIDAAPYKAGDIVAAAVAVDPSRAGRITHLAVLRVPNQEAVIVAAAVKAAPEQKPWIVDAAEKAAGRAAAHPGVRWYFPFR